MSRYRESYYGKPQTDFALMPEGKMPVQVVNATVKNAKSGNEVWELQLEVVGEKFAGRKLWFYVGMSLEAEPIRRGTLTALGLDTSPENKAEWDLIDDVIGRKAYAEIYHDTYQGEKREKVKRLRTWNRSIEKNSNTEVIEGLDTENVPF